MRIGLVIYGSLDTVSGGYLYDRKLVEYLRRHGDTVEIISLPWINYPRHVLQNFSPRIKRAMESCAVDVWLQDELNHPSLFQLNPELKRHSQVPIISIVHHLRSSEQHPAAWMPLYRAVEKAYLQSVDGFVFNSRTTRGTVEKLIGRPANGVVATPAGDRFAGLSAEEIERRCREPGPLRLLFVGNLIRRKGLLQLLEGLARIRHETWTLDVVGQTHLEPAYTREIETKIAQFGLGERVHLWGGQTDVELSQHLARAQVFCMVSAYEGFGIVYLEAMSYGLPVIAATSGAAWEIVEDRQTGRLVDPDDCKAIAQAVESYCKEPETLLSHSQDARKRFDTFPTWQETGQKIREYLLEVIKRKTNGI